MIFGTMRHMEAYTYLPDHLLFCLDYVKTHDMENWEPGRYEIDDDRMFVNLVEYETTTKENRFWEAHRQYLDVHIMLDGEEQIDLNWIEDMEQQAFVPEQDFLPLEGEANSHVVLKRHDFLICYPGDGHRTAIQTGQSIKIKKAIFKVLI